MADSRDGGRFLIAAIACAAAAAAAGAQTPCPFGWTGGLTILDAPNGGVFDMVAFDDGRGSSLFVCGGLGAVGWAPAASVARWDGAVWDPLPPAVPPFEYVNALVVFDDGTGPALHALGAVFPNSPVPTGAFGQVQRWTGSGWVALPGTLTGNALAFTANAAAVYDSGFGAELIVAGTFLMIGGQTFTRVAAWNGTTWRPLGGGLGAGYLEGVNALYVFDDGSGPALYAGGNFTAAGGAPAGGVAKWDGTIWSPVGSLVPGYTSIEDFQAFDPGAGLRLHACGQITLAPGAPSASLASWDGSAWTSLAPAGITDLAVFDDGNGPSLHVAGGFTTVFGVALNHVARWDGMAWLPLGSGLGTGSGGNTPILAVFDDGTGPALYAAGNFATAGGVFARGLAKWNGSAWSSLGGSGALNAVTSLARFDDGSGPAVYGAGQFRMPGSASPADVARWTGTTWSPVAAATGGSGYYPAPILATHASGTGPELIYARGGLTAMAGVPSIGIARWNGAAWSALGGGVTGQVFALASHDDGAGPKLYAGGMITAAGGIPVASIARWDGAAWSPVGAGLPGGTRVNCLAVHDDGNGATLYAGSDNNYVGAGPSALFRWDGAQWMPVPSWTGTHSIAALASMDDGTGPGLFGAIPGPALSLIIARWSLSGFLPLGTLTLPPLYQPAYFYPSPRMTGFDDGTGAALVVSGSFTMGTPGGITARNIVRWHPVQGWSAFDSGTDQPVLDLLGFDDGSGPALFAAGNFQTAGGLPSIGLARWGPARPRLLAAPQPRTALLGSPFTFLAVASGAAPLSFQWGRNGALIPGATSSTLSLPSVTSADAGLYDVTVTNACGSAVSPPAPLQVVPVQLRLGQDLGPGSATLRVRSGFPAATCLTALSFDSANWMNPGAGAIAGLHLGFPEFVLQMSSGLPFTGTTDASGSLDFLLPSPAPPPVLLGRSLYGVSAVLAPTTAAVLGVSPVAHAVFE